MGGNVSLFVDLLLGLRLLPKDQISSFLQCFKGQCRLTEQDKKKKKERKKERKKKRKKERERVRKKENKIRSEETEKNQYLKNIDKRNKKKER